MSIVAMAAFVGAKVSRKFNRFAYLKISIQTPEMTL
jgi:hypothetical protein